MKDCNGKFSTRGQELLHKEIMATASKIQLFKFPRTRHLFDAGGSGVSRDDLLMDAGEEKVFYTGTSPNKKGKAAVKKGGRMGNGTLVSIEEKVDGANLGISLGDDMRFLVQNRSHYVNSKTHRQFAPLDSWLSEHSAGLFQTLGDVPGNYVLFGEWLYAKHSIHYTRLPGYFMAFDLYDCKAGKFFSWRERDRRLEGSGIPTVRQIDEKTLSGREDVSSCQMTLSVSIVIGLCLMTTKLVTEQD